MQTKKHSAIESLANIAVGIGIAFGTQVVVFPWFGLHATLAANLGITAIFTVVSFVRSYTLRRVFNWISAMREAA